MSDAIKHIKPLSFPWVTQDPFLFCVHHEDFYPEGNEVMGPNASLKGRQIGQDFTVKDGWRMYHGSKVPGFPAHPHRGFETVTITTKGVIDHSDSLGAAARFGFGDTQWMTAGKGVQHAEMFPLLQQDKENPLELFQIWLNLPRRSKMVNPHFAMLWHEEIPSKTYTDSNNLNATIRLISGKFDNLNYPAPAPDSWAADPANEVVILTLKMDANARFTIPKTQTNINRSLFFYTGKSISINGKKIDSHSALELYADVDAEIQNGAEKSYFLLLQGKPIGEPVAQHGPFVMNSQAEIQQALQDYHRTEFGGWPWKTYEHVHERNKERFALHADGKLEQKPL